jgi:hypothetical protein
LCSESAGAKGEGEGEGKRDTSRGAAPDPDILALHEAWVSETGRDPSRNELTSATTKALARLLKWGGSVEAAKAGIRAVGASAWHRGTDPANTGGRCDSLADKPFRTELEFQKWIAKATERRPSHRERVPETVEEFFRRTGGDGQYGPAGPRAPLLPFPIPSPPDPPELVWDSFAEEQNK